MLVEMKPPTKAHELQQMLWPANWMRTAIQDYSELVNPLQAALEKACRKLEKRTIRSLPRVDLAEHFGPDQYWAF